MKKLAMTSLVFVLAISVGFAGSDNKERIKTQKARIAAVENPFVDFGTQLSAPVAMKAISTVATSSPADGIVLDNTDYDYGWNSGAGARSIVVFDGKVHFQFHNRNTTLTAPANRRSSRYAFYDGTTVLKVDPQPKATSASGFGGLDVFKSGDGAGVAVWVAHTPCFFGIDGSPGGGAFTVSNVPGRTGLDPEITVDKNNVLWYIDSGAPTTRSKYYIANSTDFGATWTTVDTNLTSQFAPFTIGSLDVPIRVGPNNEKYLFTSVTGNNAYVAPYGSGHPDSVDQIGYFKTTNDGATWTWTRVIPNAKELVFGTDTLYALVTNFDQFGAAIDKDGTIHMLFNGYMQELTSDTTATDRYGSLYWNSTAPNTFKLISNPAILKYQAWDSLSAVYAGNTYGFAYPTIAVDTVGNGVFAMWVQPRTTGGGTNLALNEGWATYDLYYATSATNGASWSAPQKLTGGEDGVFPQVYPILDNPTPTTARAHVIFIKDTIPGGALDTGARTGLVPVMYQTIDFALTSVERNGSTPKAFALDQNYPNPFNPTTNIRFALNSRGFVSLKVFNVIGQEVATLVNENLDAGSYSAKFDASKLPSGVYMYRLEADGFTDVKKMVLMK